MQLEFGDIVLVPFPFTSQTASKKRPAVVVSSREYNIARPDVVIAAVTSQVRAKIGFEETMLVDWKGAGLLKPSVIKPVFATLEQSLVLRKMGSLKRSDVQPLRESLGRVLR